MRKLLFLFLLATVSACSTVDHTLVKSVSVESVTAIPVSAQKSTIEFKKLMYATEAGKEVETNAFSAFCNLQNTAKSTGAITSTSEGTTVEIIKSALMLAGGYKLINLTANVFDAAQISADYQIAAKVIDSYLSTCSSPYGVKGSSYVKIEWQIYSKKSSGVITTIVTEGSFRLNTFDSNTDRGVIYRNSFRPATLNFLASSEVKKVLTQ
jgi:hypothetical protein